MQIPLITVSTNTVYTIEVYTSVSMETDSFEISKVKKFQKVSSYYLLSLKIRGESLQGRKLFQKIWYASDSDYTHSIYTINFAYQIMVHQKYPIQILFFVLHVTCNHSVKLLLHFYWTSTKSLLDSIQISTGIEFLLDYN